jgi:hypothetical protein
VSPPADNSGAAIDQGTGILDSLFSDATLTGIVNALARHTGIDSVAGRKLLGVLTPAILSAIAARFAGRPVTPQGLTSFFAEERGALTSALPAGFSLANVPGVPNVGSVLRHGGEAAPSGFTPIRWLAPALGIAALALVMFFVFRGPTLSVPGADKVTTDLNDACKALTSTVEGIKDEPSAASAARELKKLDATFDGLKRQVKRLPEADKQKVMGVAKANLDRLEGQYARVVWVPGVDDQVRLPLDDVMAQLAAMGGVPAPKAAGAVSGEVAGAVTALNQTLRGIKDGPSAELALAKLKEIDGKLDDARANVGKLGESARSAVGAMVKPAVEKVREQAERLQGLPGAGEKVRPVVEGILKKLSGLAA